MHVYVRERKEGGVQMYLACFTFSFVCRVG